MTEPSSGSREFSIGGAGLATREAEWSRGLAAFSLAWLAFETLTGLSIYFLPFSVPNQWMVILHTGVGLVALIPALW